MVWKPPPEITSPLAQLEDLMLNLYARGFVEASCVAGVQAWVTDLVQIGYMSRQHLGNRSNVDAAPAGVDVDTKSTVEGVRPRIMGVGKVGAAILIQKQLTNFVSQSQASQNDTC